VTEPARLHPDDLAALAEMVAAQVIAALRQPRAEAPVLIDAAEVARRFSVSAEWVRENADRLGAVRIGDGRRPRLRFDPARVEEALTGRGNGVPSQSDADSAAEPRTPRPTVARAGNALDRLPVRELEPRRPRRDRPGAADTARGTTPRSTP
jgi:hypothetical protein